MSSDNQNTHVASPAVKHNHFKTVLAVPTKRARSETSVVTNNKNATINLNNIPLFSKNNFEKLDIDTLLSKNINQVNESIQAASGRYRNSGVYNQQQQNILQDHLLKFQKKTPLNKELNRIVMSFRSKEQFEIMWSLRKLLQLSSKDSGNSIFKKLYKDFIDMALKSYELLDFTKPFDTNEISVVENSLTCILIIRNLSQDLNNITNLIKLNNSSFKNLILKYLIFIKKSLYGEIQIYYENKPFLKEFQHYIIDLMEAIASFIQPIETHSNKHSIHGGEQIDTYHQDKNNNDNDTNNNNNHGDDDEDDQDQLFFKNLVAIFQKTKDKYLIISILRSFSRLLVRSTKNYSKTAINLDDSTLTKIVSLLLHDNSNDHGNDELLLAVLDFLHQYILQGNSRIENLFENEERLNILNAVIPKLLSFNIENLPDYNHYNNKQIKLIQRVQPKIPDTPPELKPALFEEILKLEEPARSTAFLRCCFEPDLDAEFTQIKLWRCYDSLFGKTVKENNRKMIAAVDFIKNVSNSISTASAVVFPDPQDSNKKRFVVKGIKPRPFAVDIPTGNKLAMIEPEVLMEIAKNIGRNHGSSVNQSENKDSTSIFPKQTKLGSVKFPAKLSDVSNTTSVLLTYFSNSKTTVTATFCENLKPAIIKKIMDIPPLAAALSTYLDNTQKFQELSY